MNTEYFFETKTLGEAWLRSLSFVMSGEWIEDEGERLLEACPLCLRIKTIEEDDEIIVRHADKDRIALMKKKYISCDVLPQYRISYGALLYDNRGVNQIQWLIERLRAKRETKSATVTLHSPGETALSCLSMLDFKIRREQLHMAVVYRSQNIFASQPGNVLSLRDIQKYIANAVGCSPGPIDLLIASAHIYERDITSAASILSSCF